MDHYSMCIALLCATRWVEKGLVTLPDSDVMADMFATAVKVTRCLNVGGLSSVMSDLFTC